MNWKHYDPPTGPTADKRRELIEEIADDLAPRKSYIADTCRITVDAFDARMAVQAMLGEVYGSVDDLMRDRVFDFARTIARVQLQNMDHDPEPDAWLAHNLHGG